MDDCQKVIAACRAHFLANFMCSWLSQQRIMAHPGTERFGATASRVDSRLQPGNRQSSFWKDDFGRKLTISIAPDFIRIIRCLGSSALLFG